MAAIRLTQPKLASRPKAESTRGCVFLIPSLATESHRENAHRYGGLASEWLYIESDPLGLTGGSYSTYAYANGDPINYSDPFGLYAKVVVNGNHVYITIPITYSGPGVLIPGLTDNWNMAISQAWSGQFGQYDVSTIITDGPENQIFVASASGRSDVNPAGHNTGIWRAFGDPRAPAHEAGHLMGLGDQYWPWSGQPFSGSEHDIMGVLGQPPSEQDITDIINWSQGRL